MRYLISFLLILAGTLPCWAQEASKKTPELPQDEQDVVSECKSENTPTDSVFCFSANNNKFIGIYSQSSIEGTDYKVLDLGEFDRDSFAHIYEIGIFYDNAGGLITFLITGGEIGTNTGKKPDGMSDEDFILGIARSQLNLISRDDPESIKIVESIGKALEDGMKAAQVSKKQLQPTASPRNLKLAPPVPTLKASYGSGVAPILRAALPMRGEQIMRRALNAQRLL